MKSAKQVKADMSATGMRYIAGFTDPSGVVDVGRVERSN